MTHKKLLFAILLVLGIAAGCSHRTIGLLPAATPTEVVVASPTDLPPTPTFTATPTPLPTPTPVPLARVASGDHALFNGDWETAIKEYETALDNSQDSEIKAAALLGLGRTYYAAGDDAAALNYLRELVDKYPNSNLRPAGFYVLGEAYQAITRYSEAADAFQHYLALRPGVIDSYVLEKRGDALFAGGEYADALNDYQAARQSERAGSSIPLQIKVARTTAITGDYTTAIVMYNDIYARAQDDNTKAQVDYLMGQAYMAAAQVDDAKAAFLDAIGKYPLAYDSYLALVAMVDAGFTVDELDRGLVDYFAGQYPVAIAAFDRYLSDSPADPATAHYYKGLALSALDKTDMALDEWETVIKNFDGSPLWDNAWEQKAYLQWSVQEKYDIATQTLTDFVSLAPHNTRAPEFLFDAARVAERAKHLDTAAILWERVSTDYPTSSYAFNSLFLAGIARYRLGDYPAAKATFERLQGISANITQQSQSLFWMGKTQQAAGDAPGAQASYQKAASTDPTGYYSLRAGDLLAEQAAFSPPPAYDLSFDRVIERSDAESWLRTTFNLPPETDLSGLGALAGDPGLIRGAELWNVGEDAQAEAEFEDLRIRNENDAANTYRLANYFISIGLYRSGIFATRQVLTLAGMDDAATMHAPNYFNHLRFGPYYADLIIPVAQAYNFDPLLLFSVVRQESLFDSISDSPAAARGLMQIIASTGAGIAKQYGWPPNYTADDLYRPKVSITFGADYLDQQRSYLGGDLYAALAAYNGGPGNSDAWKQLSNGDPDLFLEVIRFDETHRYISNIYEIYSIYRRLYWRNP